MPNTARAGLITYDAKDPDTKLTPIEQLRPPTPKSPEEGYHLMEDMTDQAIGWIGQQKALAPDKPFFICWNEMPEDFKPVLRREMEVYAGFMELTDHHVGRLFDTIDKLGITDIVYKRPTIIKSSEGNPQIHGQVIHRVQPVQRPVAPRHGAPIHTIVVGVEPVGEAFDPPLEWYNRGVTHSRSVALAPPLTVASSGAA